MRWSIRYQLLVPLLTLLIGVVGTSTWTALTSVHRARQQIETQVRNVARVLSESRFPLTSNVLEQTKGLSGAEFLLRGIDGHLVATLPTDGAQLPPAEDTADDWQRLHLGPRATFGGQTYLCCGVRLMRPGTDGSGTLYILYPESLWRDALWEALRPSLILGGFGALASVALAAGVARRLSGRIQDLERRTRHIAAGDFSPMPLSGSNDELYDLGRSVNDMAQQLEQLQQAMQKNERLRLLGQVSAGLAHQLRNSVTGARLAVQLHARECDSAADGEDLEVALRQLALLESNLKRFLELGRPDRLHFAPCHLVSLVEETLALLRPQCRHARIDLRWHPPEEALTLQGDAGQLRQVLLNVLGNAVEAAGTGGWVAVRVHSNGSGAPAVIEIHDSGSGAPPDVADHLFELFVTGKRDGVGLGLAVARRIVELHGGSIVYSREDSQTCFRIQLPLRATALNGAAGEAEKQSLLSLE